MASCKTTAQASNDERTTTGYPRPETAKTSAGATTPPLAANSRWDYSEKYGRQGEVGALARLHASDEYFQDLASYLYVGCIGNSEAKIWIEDNAVGELPARTISTPVRYTVDSNAAVETKGDVIQPTRTVTFAGHALATKLLTANSLTVAYTAPGNPKPLFFLMSGLSEIRNKMAKACPHGAF